MKNLLLLSLLLTSSFVFAQKKKPVQKKTEVQNVEEPFRARYANLEGKWLFKKGSRTICEEWIFINDSTASGRSYIVWGTDTTIMENISLEQRMGVIKYIPTVNGQNNNMPVEFVAIEFLNGKGLSDAEIGNQMFSTLFNNPHHDSPKYISYLITRNKLEVKTGDDARFSSNRKEFYFEKVR